MEGKNYRYTMKDSRVLYMHVQSMGFRVPALDQSDCSICYNYDLILNYVCTKQKQLLQWFLFPILLLLTSRVAIGPANNSLNETEIVCEDSVSRASLSAVIYVINGDLVTSNAAVKNMPYLPQLGVYSVLGRGSDIKT